MFVRIAQGHFNGNAVVLQFLFALYKVLTEIPQFYALTSQWPPMN